MVWPPIKLRMIRLFSYPVNGTVGWALSLTVLPFFESWSKNHAASKLVHVLQKFAPCFISLISLLVPQRLLTPLERRLKPLLSQMPLVLQTFFLLQLLLQRLFVMSRATFTSGTHLWIITVICSPLYNDLLLIYRILQEQTVWILISLYFLFFLTTRQRFLCMFQVFL